MFLDYSLKTLFGSYLLLLLFSFLLILTSTQTMHQSKSSLEPPRPLAPIIEIQKSAERRFEGRMVVSEDIPYPSTGPLRPEMHVEQVIAPDIDDFDGYIDQNENDSQADDDDLTFIPIPEIKQLPFCNHQTKSTVQNDHDHLPLEDEASIKEDNETIVVNTNRRRTIENGQFILVATLDGKIFMMDSETGKILWSLCTGQIFSSTISSLQLSEQGKFIKLIPSLTGGLYKYDGDSLLAIPLNADSLLKKSFKLAQDVMITGGKEVKTLGINIDSGVVKYECGFDGCKSPTQSTTEEGSLNSTSGIVLVVRKQLQTVRAVDSLTGIERWNFSVGTHELALAGITEGCYEAADHITLNSSEQNLDLKMLIPEGLLFKVDSSSQSPLWKHKFDNPISQAWVLESGKLISLDPIKFSPPNMENHSPPSLYVGVHKQQLYVQESQSVANLLSSTFELEGPTESDTGTTSSGREPLKLEWKPSIQTITAESLEVDNNEGPTALAPYHQNYIPPFFVYEQDRIPAIEAPPNTSSSVDNICVDEDEKLEQVDDEEIEEVRGNGFDLDEDDPLSDTVTMGLVTLWFWWKEVLGISLLTAVILNILLMRPVIHIVRQRTIQEMLHNVNIFRIWRDHNVPALLPPSPSFRNSTSSDTLIDGSGSSPALQDHRNRTVSSSSTHSSNNLDEQQLVPFESQYLKEFEPVQCLGRGAFGTVFEAKKRIDDRNYAVKRIPLPNRPKSRDRVMREVKALARLEHKNIVRYFNAWIENPPYGWLEKNDPLWNLCKPLSSLTQTMSEFGSMNSQGFASGDYSTTPSYMSHRKKDHSEIFVPDKTPDDDSFIVFEASPGHSIEPVPEEIENSGEESDSPSEEDGWISDSSLSSAPDLKPAIDDNSNSKFFCRPTTLDIPSSNENSKIDGALSLDFSTPTATNNDPSVTSIMYLYIQQELCQKRTLQDWLRIEQNRTLSQVVKIFSQIIEAVDYIHSNNLIHRDLKPGNIFLAGGGTGTGSDDQENITVKLGDFGLATTLVGQQDQQHQENPKLLISAADPTTPISSKLTGQVGTHLYMSPEQFQKRNYDHKVDIYSLGLIFFELLVPFGTDMERHNELTKVRKLHFSKSFRIKYPEQYELIQSMVSHNPTLRPNTKEIKKSLESSNGYRADINIGAFRSKSFPGQLLEDHYLGGGRNKLRRHFYKTHSAM